MMEYTSHNNRHIFLLLWYHPARKIRNNITYKGLRAPQCRRTTSRLFLSEFLTENVLEGKQIIPKSIYKIIIIFKYMQM